MAQLRQDYQEFVDRKTEIVVAGPENAEAFKKYFEKNDLPFIGLPDPKASVLKLYGQEVNIFKWTYVRSSSGRSARGGQVCSLWAFHVNPENAEMLTLI